MSNKKEKGYSVRINKQNGDMFFGTCDFRLDRINVEIENDIVAKINGIG
jgi:hypothetical protein